MCASFFYFFCYTCQVYNGEGDILFYFIFMTGESTVAVLWAQTGKPSGWRDSLQITPTRWTALGKLGATDSTEKVLARAIEFVIKGLCDYLFHQLDFLTRVTYFTHICACVRALFFFFPFFLFLHSFVRSIIESDMTTVVGTFGSLHLFWSFDRSSNTSIQTQLRASSKHPNKWIPTQLVM